MSTNLPFFVYGTLRPGEGNYNWSLAGKTTNEDTATMAGAIMFDYNGGSFPFVAASPNQDDVVVGTVITVADEHYDSVLVSIDRLEGYDANHPKQGMYRREQVTVTTEDGRDILANVYICGHLMLDQVRRYPRIVSGDWWARDTSADPYSHRFTD